MMSKVPPIEINAILNVVLEETDFLLDDKIMSEISKRPPKEKLLLKMNVLRKVLAIGDDLEFNKLLWRIWQTTDPEDPVKYLFNELIATQPTA